MYTVAIPRSVGYHPEECKETWDKTERHETSTNTGHRNRKSFKPKIESSSTSLIEQRSVNLDIHLKNTICPQTVPKQAFVIFKPKYYELNMC